MGFMDMFSNIFGEQSSSGGGILGSLSQITRIKKEMEERANRPKPGKYCGSTCGIDDDRCRACLELQSRFERSLHQLEKLEEVSEFTSDRIQQMSSGKKVTKCTLCGAPFEKDANECPYCGTAYPEGALDFDIPLSKSGRNELLMKKAQETWNIYVENAELTHEYNKTLPAAALGEQLLKFTKATTGMSYHDMLAHDVKELMQGARHYGVSLSQYIHGVALDNMKTPKNLYYEEQSRILNEQSRQRDAAFAAQQAQRAQKSSYTAMDYLQRHAETASYGYSGGSGPSTTGSCCGNCRYYLLHDKKCLYFAGTSGEHRSGPNDYCNNHRS